MNHLHPLTVEMMRCLPPPGEKFPLGPRVRWLRAMAAILDYLYTNDEVPPSTLAPIEVSFRPAGSASEAAADIALDGSFAMTLGWLSLLDAIPAFGFASAQDSAQRNRL